MAARLENLAALHLLKACHFWTDTAVGEFDLHFVRDKSKREVDFLATRDQAPWILVECKSGDKTVSASLRYFSELVSLPHRYQLVRDIDYDRRYADGVYRVLSYDRFFRELP